MIDFIKKEVKLAPISFDDLELIQTNLIEEDHAALAEQISLLFGIKYDVIKKANQPQNMA